MEAAGRYSPFSWTTAVAVSAAAWAAHFNFPELSVAAFWLAVLAVVAWIVTRWAARIARKAPSGETPEPAILRASLSFMFVVFAIYATAMHAWALGIAYPEPNINRAYAESLGIELGPYFLASFAVAVVVAILAFAAIRALRAPEPAHAAPLWLACVAAPAGWVMLALGLSGAAESIKAQWTAFGADLPSPTLLVLASEEYLAVFALIACTLGMLAWFVRARPRAFRRIAAVQLFLVLLCAAYFTLAVVSSVLPLFKMCGAV